MDMFYTVYTLGERYSFSANSYKEAVDMARVLAEGGGFMIEYGINEDAPMFSDRYSYCPSIGVVCDTSEAL